MFRAHLNPGTRVALLCAALIATLVLIDLGAVAAVRAIGWRQPSFVPTKSDLFADYFKFVFSFPGGEAVRPSEAFGLQTLLSSYQSNNPYGGAEALGRGGMTNLHVTPLTALFSVVNAWAMGWMDPVLLFGTLVLGLAAWWVAIAVRYADTPRAGALWSAIGLACYPAAMIVVRGNVYAGASGLLIIGSLLSVLRGERVGPAAAMLAIACCIRPNAALFFLPLLLLARDMTARKRAASWFAATAIGVTAMALLAVRPFYPDYTLAHFREALAIYRSYYVEGSAGLAYNSSAFGALKLTFGPQPWLEGAGLAVGGLLASAVIALAWNGRMRSSSVLFVTCSAYVLGSTVIADYHLLPFLLPPMALAIETRTKPMNGTGWVMLAASCLILSPKNLSFGDDWSPQIVLNPMILLYASLWVLVQEWQDRRPALHIASDKHGLLT